MWLPLIEGKSIGNHNKLVSVNTSALRWESGLSFMSVVLDLTLTTRSLGESRRVGSGQRDHYYLVFNRYKVVFHTLMETPESVNKLTKSVVISTGTDYIGRYKSKYHTNSLFQWWDHEGPILVITYRGKKS